MAHRNVSVRQADVACAACVAHLAEADYQLLPEADAEVVREHLSECSDCRLFKQQLETTREVLAAMPAPQLTADLAAVLEEARSERADRRVEPLLPRLYRVAAALEVEDADELVQQTVLDAISSGTALDSGELIGALIDAARRARSEPTDSLDEAADPGSVAYDPDSETAELFYPTFYQEGPDVGRFVDSPNAWGHEFRLGPEDELATIELLEVADSAVEGLPDVEKRLITLVDVENVSLAEAAKALGVGENRAAQSLNSARIHVRGALDHYLTTSAT
jgi:DNA-directed RNA polymerase specialized sigma24 family protein